MHYVGEVGCAMDQNEMRFGCWNHYLTLVLPWFHLYPFVVTIYSMNPAKSSLLFFALPNTQTPQEHVLQTSTPPQGFKHHTEHFNLLQMFHCAWGLGLYPRTARQPFATGLHGVAEELMRSWAATAGGPVGDGLGSMDHLLQIVGLDWFGRYIVEGFQKKTRPELFFCKWSTIGDSHNDSCRDFKCRYHQTVPVANPRETHFFIIF